MCWRGKTTRVCVCVCVCVCTLVEGHRPLEALDDDGDVVDAQDADLFREWGGVIGTVRRSLGRLFHPAASVRACACFATTLSDVTTRRAA